jgi:hypothetical protein
MNYNSVEYATTLGGLPKNSREFSIEPSFIRTTNFTKKPIIPLHFAKTVSN